jgi:hypothetical protein
VKILYDKPAAEVRVSGRKDGRKFEKTFPVEADLAVALKAVQGYVMQEAAQ